LHFIQISLLGLPAAAALGSNFVTLSRNNISPHWATLSSHLHPFSFVLKKHKLFNRLEKNEKWLAVK
jgi:hypothetical protein